MHIVQKYIIDLYKKLIEIWHNFGPLRAQNYIIYNWKFIFIVQIRMHIVQKYIIGLYKKLIEIWHNLHHIQLKVHFYSVNPNAQNYVLYNWKLIFIVYIRMQIVQKYKFDLFKKLLKYDIILGPYGPKIISYTIDSSFLYCKFECKLSRNTK